MIRNTDDVRVSIVIPVYNEAEHLAACLRAIGRQTSSPFEVIVVDNNSTDDTKAVAEQFAFVKVLSERRQGVVHARRRGFNAAQGTIIGRIDADTLISEDWVATIEKVFQNPNIDALSGSVYYYDVTLPDVSGYLDTFFRQRLANQLGNEVFLYGANMAIRRGCWLRVRSGLCLQGGLHEDFDLAIHAEQAGAHVIFYKPLKAAVSLRRFDGNLREFWRYAMLSPLTYARHGRKSQRHMYTVIAVVLSAYWFIWLNHQLYDPQRERLSVKHVFQGPSQVRVNPATFVE